MRSMRLRSRSSLYFLPVALLLLGVAVHGVRIIVHDVDSQRGSAFAMFSTADIGATRRVVATAPGAPPFSLDIPESLSEVRGRLADAPSDELARELAAILRDRKWETDGRTATPGDETTFDQVRIQVVGLDVDGRTVSRQVFADVVVGSPDP